jgi:hypothetical protein
MASSSASRTLLQPSGMASLTKFLQAERPKLLQAPILVISSQPAANQPSLSPVSQACQHVQFTLGQKMGMRVVPSTVSSAFPTLHDLELRLELARRTGASSVVAVGSGAAVDLAKALSHEHDWDNVILVPATHAAVMACASSHSLFLDPIEEALIPLPTNINTNTSVNTNITNTVVATLEEKLMAPVDTSHVVYASLAIALDAMYRQNHNPLALQVFQKASAALNADAADPSHQALTHESAMELLYQSGSLLSYGLGREDRSTPMALASSLIPRIFPHVHMVSFLASMVPGLCRVMQKEQEVGSSSYDPSVQILIQKVLQHNTDDIPQLTVISDEFKGFSVPDMALSHIRQNQTLWNCLDVPDSVLTELLSHSLKR